MDGCENNSIGLVTKYASKGKKKNFDKVFKQKSVTKEFNKKDIDKLFGVKER
nr:MAG TPA: hypothetical protein [Bacteriophage sp.]